MARSTPPPAPGSFRHYATSTARASLRTQPCGENGTRPSDSDADGPRPNPSSIQCSVSWTGFGSEREFHPELTLERIERLTRLPEAGGDPLRREPWCRALVVLIVVEVDRVEQVEHFPQHLGVGRLSEAELL